MELERRLNLKINYMQLETKLGRNTIEIKFVHWYTWAKGDIMIHFSKIIWAVISAQKDFNSRNKIVKEGSRIPNVINKHLATAGNRPANNLLIPQKRRLNYVDKRKSPISSFLFNQFYPKNYCQKYYLYQMINLVVYTLHLPNSSNVQVPS